MTTQLGKFESRSASYVSVGGDTELRGMLLDIVLEFERSRPRSTQRRIGPSEVGEPCVRKLGYKVSGFPEPGGTESDPWFAIMGTATHAWLADALEHRNQKLGYRRWLIEEYVQPRHLLSGSCDAYDQDEGRVVDHKVVGKSSWDKYRRDGLSAIYTTQIHLYGLGMANAGQNVRTVSIALYPRFTDISRGLHVITETYNPDIAFTALHRLSVIEKLVERLDVVNDPSQFKRLPMSPGPSCRYCPWQLPGEDTGATCPGTLK